MNVVPEKQHCARTSHTPLRHTPLIKQLLASHGSSRYEQSKFVVHSGGREQISSSSADPEQSAPPPEGSGSVQVRVRECMPNPGARGMRQTHSLQSDQSLQPPSTGGPMHPPEEQQWSQSQLVPISPDAQLLGFGQHSEPFNTPHEGKHTPLTHW